jgi:hypothetical protein
MNDPKIIQELAALRSRVAELESTNPAAKPFPWGIGRFRNWRPFPAIKTILSERGEDMREQELFEAIRNEGWYPDRAKNFFEKKPAEQYDAAWDGFQKSIDLNKTALHRRPGGYISLGPPGKKARKH